MLLLLIVKIKPIALLETWTNSSSFQFLIVKIKPKLEKMQLNIEKTFQFLIVKIKPFKPLQ